MQIKRMANGDEPDLALAGEAAVEQFKALEGCYLRAWLKRDAVKASSASAVT